MKVVLVPEHRGCGGDVGGLPMPCVASVLKYGTNTYGRHVERQRIGRLHSDGGPGGMAHLLEAQDADVHREEGQEGEHRGVVERGEAPRQNE